MTENKHIWHHSSHSMNSWSTSFDNERIRKVFKLLFNLAKLLCIQLRNHGQRVNSSWNSSSRHSSRYNFTNSEWGGVFFRWHSVITGAEIWSFNDAMEQQCVCQKSKSIMIERWSRIGQILQLRNQWMNMEYGTNWCTTKWQKVPKMNHFDIE